MVLLAADSMGHDSTMPKMRAVLLAALDEMPACIRANHGCAECAEGGQEQDHWPLQQASSAAAAGPCITAATALVAGAAGIFGCVQSKPGAHCTASALSRN